MSLATAPGLRRSSSRCSSRGPPVVSCGDHLAPETAVAAPEHRLDADRPPRRIGDVAGARAPTRAGAGGVEPTVAIHDGAVATSSTRRRGGRAHRGRGRSRRRASPARPWGRPGHRADLWRRRAAGGRDVRLASGAPRPRGRHGHRPAGVRGARTSGAGWRVSRGSLREAGGQVRPRQRFLDRCVAVDPGSYGSLVTAPLAGDGGRDLHRDRRRGRGRPANTSRGSRGWRAGGSARHRPARR